MKTKFCFIIVFIFSVSFCVRAQKQDSMAVYADSVTKKKQDKKAIYSHARRATVMSAILPGLGQGYNKKYWKIPIIYAGLGGFTYMLVTNNDYYYYYLNNLLAVYDDDPSTVNTSGYQANQLEVLKDQYRKNRDLAIIGLAVVYALNIIDANIDGHLRTFDVSDDLSLQLDPWQQWHINEQGGFKASLGLSFKLNFK